MTYTSLPSEYTSHTVINLRKGKPHAAWVYTLNLLIFAAAVLLASRHIPFLSMFEAIDGNYVLTVPRLLLNLVMVAFTLLFYAIGQLFFKGLFCKLLGGDTPKFGIKGWYYYVGSHTYLCKGKYILLVLLPELVLFALLTLLCLLLPLQFFWIVFFVEALHIARFSASLYLIVLVLAQPQDALFRNMGTLTMVYTKK